ncbi:MAG TPA: hypothetical protein VL346_12125, partial [Acidobacteriaceae bacterium]|nr:hypothetical protein [Acidobacteriaceae bacterium]
LAHLLKYDTFASDRERDAAAEKFTSKRNLLARYARTLIDAGIEYKLSELPLSLRTPEQLAELSSLELADQAARAAQAQPAEEIELSSHGALPSLQQEIDEYLQKRHHTQNHAAAS